MRNETQPRVTFGVVGFRFFKRIDLFSTQYCFAQPNLRGDGDRYEAMAIANI
ncbi:hypothetical protein [Microcystis aeruginosa]|uniref:hypothetical protein n=1 Tax=Microcystis aeruginosa TaxID=1126 RepID=UPI00147BD798|nr:hypothetical protein [Microcystis aeruginosa]